MKYKERKNFVVNMVNLRGHGSIRNYTKTMEYASCDIDVYNTIDHHHNSDDDRSGDDA